MPHPLRPDSSARQPMTLEQLQALVDAHGAHPGRWPEEMRTPALALLATSAEARSVRDAAARLDAALDVVSTPPPSPELVARVLAGSPRTVRSRSSVLRWRLAAAAPLLAAAAAIVVWLLPSAEDTRPAAVQYAINDLGVYTTPTDLLLVPPGFDLSGSLPTLGCGESDLGCLVDEAPGETQSSLSNGQGVSV